MRAKKRFGQHFLHDTAVVERIVAALAPEPNQRLVEIGPGRGALTLPVLATGTSLQVVEIDRDLCEALRALAATKHGSLVVHEADALRFDFAALAEGQQKLRVFGNLPYNVGTELLFRLLQQGSAISDMLFMLQKEVAERLVATPGSKSRGRLSVMAQTWCDVRLLFTVGPGAFTPPPAVDSAIVRLVPRPHPAVGPERARWFTDLVRRAFAQRRKTLRNTLRGCLSESEILACGVDPRARAETLSNEQFVKLAANMASKPPMTDRQS